MSSRAWVVPAVTLLSNTLGILLATGSARAQSLSAETLVKTLQKGGYVIVMAPRELAA
jgi:hypothetical protein